MFLLGNFSWKNSYEKEINMICDIINFVLADSL